MDLNTIKWNPNVFQLKTLKILWFPMQSYELYMILYQIIWFGCDSQYNSMKHQWVSTKHNEHFMIHDIIHWNINGFLLKPMKIIWFSIQLNDISMFFNLKINVLWFLIQINETQWVSSKVDENKIFVDWGSLKNSIGW